MTIAIIEIEPFDGPNLWLERPVVRVVLNGVRNAYGAIRLADSLAQLDAALNRSQHSPLPLLAGVDGSDSSWWLGWGAIGLQRLAGDDVRLFFARPLEQDGLSEVVVECRHQQTGLLAIRLALQEIITLSAVRRTSFDLASAFERQLAQVAASGRPDSSKGCILDAARARGIPITSIDPRGRIDELGTGIYRQRLFNTKTSNTSAIGEMISSNKQLSLHYLRECGLPVPDTYVARERDRAVERAQSIGFPVVVKPIDEGDAAGVYVDLRTEDEVRTAFDDAAAVSGSSTVVVQRYLTGKDYRFLVVGGKIVAVIRRIPAHVVGDGAHTVRELVQIENQNPRRGKKKSDPLKRIEIGPQAIWTLERQGLGSNDIPAAGRRVQMHPIGHISAGGEAVEMTAAVHPDNVEIVVAAACALEVDIAGVDLIAEDIEQSIWETSGGIVEVNCGPGFWIHQYPSSGEAIDPGPAVIDTLFPPGSPVRIPVIAVTGTCDTGEISQLVGRLLLGTGVTAGIAAGDELWLGTTQLRGINGSGVAGKRRILLNPSVETAVLEISPAEIVAEGLAFEVCDVAVVTSLSEAPIPGWPPVESVISRTLAASGVVVAPGDDTAVLEFARNTGRPTVLYAIGGDSELASNPVASDRAVILRDEASGHTLEIFDGADSSRTLVQWPSALLTTLAGVASIAALLALGYSADTVQRLFQGTTGFVSE